MKLTEEQKQANKEARATAKKEAKELARITAEQNQREVAEIVFSISWRKSRMYGSNPLCEAKIRFKDGSPLYEYAEATASGYGYDKESTVIAEIFNRFLKYKLYRPLLPTDRDREERGAPYGIMRGDTYKYFEGGVGVNCYYAISEAIGGKFTHVASGKTFDVYKYDDLLL
jgi:hypothetical protein